jgi:hypothetical protein
VAAKMPHTMPLILKTNNLLRGIEFQLGTYNRKDAFLEVGFVVYPIGQDSGKNLLDE